MKRFACLLGLAVLLPFVSPAVTRAAEKPDPWQEKKAARFKPVTDAQRDAIVAAIPDKAEAEPKKKRRILVFYRCEGFIHTSIPRGNIAIEQLGEKTGAFSVDLADTYDVFTSENLEQYDCILLNSTTHLQFPKPSQLNAFLDFVMSGKGLVGIHAASDNFGRHPKALALVGGTFNGHPWNASGNWAFKLDDPDHRLNRTFQGKGFWHRDEIYQYKPESYQGPGVLRVLVSLDMSKPAVSGRIKDGPREVPVSWVRQAGDGRVFYTNFGHREETFQNPPILKHILDGIQYALGDLEIDDEPTANSSEKQPALAPESSGDEQ